MEVKLNQQLFSAADNLSSKMDASEYKNYLLGLIFYKYLSDKLLVQIVKLADESLKEYDTQEKQTKLYEELVSNPEMKDDLLTKVVDTLGYEIEPNYLFHVLVIRAKQNIFQLNELNMAFIQLSTKYEQFDGLFDDVDLQAKRLGYDDQQRKVAIVEIIKKLDDIDFLVQEGSSIGNAYEYLISEFAKKTNEFYTPHMISDMIAQIVTLNQEDKKFVSVFDPTMGSGSLMLNVRNYLNHPEKVKYHGQEINETTYNLAKMNLIVHGVETRDMNLRNGDTLDKDWPTNEPYTFDSVVMNPPYSAKWSADETFLNDSRFNCYGKLAPRSKADFAFLLHGYYHLKETGTMAIVLPHGVLFREAAEKTIRQKLLEDGSIYAVIGMPANLFFGTAIPTTVIILKKNRRTRDVLFIDASKEFIKDNKQNKLTKENIDKIINTYKERKDVEKYAHVASFEEIKENDYNLNILKYVDIYGLAKIVSEASFDYVSSLEGFNKYVEAVFIAIKYNNCHKNSEIEEYVASLLKEEKLSKEQYDSDIVSNRSKLGNKLTWARSFLKSNNIIENKKRGYWILTEQGEKIDSIHFNNEYFNDRFDSIDSFIFETLQVFNEDRKVYDIKFEQNQISLNNSRITKSVLIGENGAGKSSILRAVSQIYLVLSKNQEVDVRINLKDLDHTKYDLKYRVGLDRFHVQLIKEKSNIKIICKKNNYEIPFSYVIFPKKMLAISTIVNDTYMFSSNDYYKYLGTRSSANGSFKGELDKSTKRYFSEITLNDREKYLTDILDPLNISKLFIKEDQLFAKRNKESINFEYLSSGEKNYLNIFMAIISQADTSNLILIDEPESSLHPSWQVNFLSELERLLKNMGIISHVIIATHSHFLISDLSPENSYILHCSKDRKYGNMTKFIESDTYGWSAENVLYNIFGMRTTRNTYFLKDMDTMMTLVESKSENMEQLKNVINKLNKYTLSKEDPLTSLIEIAKDYYYEHKKD